MEGAASFPTAVSDTLQSGPNSLNDSCGKDIAAPADSVFEVGSCSADAELGMSSGLVGDEGQHAGIATVEATPIPPLSESGSTGETCRICLESAGGTSVEEVMLLGCACRGSLGKLHKKCAERWFNEQDTTYGSLNLHFLPRIVSV